MLLIAALIYLAAGWSCSLALRWNEGSDGVDLLIDTMLWPILIFYWLRHGR